MASGANILQEYLVRLGFSQNQTAYAQFQNALRDVNRFVENQYYSMGKHVATFQAATTTAFLGVGAAVATMAERTAAADQEYRLLALRMYTSLPVARELKVALDELGQPLENIMWDPELAKRFHQLVEDQRKLTAELGPDFEAQMLKIRDVRFEFNRFGVELKYLTMEVVRLLAKTLGTDVDGLLRKMREFNAWFIANMPQIAQWIVQHLKPALQDIKKIASETWTVIKDLSVTFTNLIAILSGDDSLKTSTADFNKFADAIEKTVHWLARLLLVTDKVIESALNLSSAIIKSQQAPLYAQAFGPLGALAWAAGQPDIQKDLKQARSDFAAAAGLTGPEIGLGPVTATPGAQGTYLSGAGPALANSANIQAAIIATAKQMGVPPELALAVAQHESNFRQFDKYGNVLVNRGQHGESHATGIFQLQPGTAKQYGVDPADVGGNITGGVSYLRDLLKQYGNQEAALQHYYGSKNVADNQKYARSVLNHKVDSSVHVGNLTVHVPSGKPEEVHRAVKKALEDTAKDRVQRNLTEFTLPGWAY